MKVFLAGVGCVGKTTIGARLAERLGCPFYDLDVEIEKHFGKPIERLRHESLTPYSFRKRFASVVLANLLRSDQDSGFVMALLPSGLMDSMWSVLKNVDRMVVVLQDSPKNILSRITFYDAESKLLVRTLDDKERQHYLDEIRKNAAYFRRSFHRADVTMTSTGWMLRAVRRKSNACCGSGRWTGKTNE